MRRLLNVALILALTVVIPASAMGELCGGSAMSCCNRPEASEPTLTRPGCCTAPCIEAAPERQEAASETRTLRLDSPDASPANAPVLVAVAHPPAGAAADPSPPPHLSRRLASLSILLI